MSEKRFIFPQNWISAPISDVARYFRGVTYSKSDAKSVPTDGYIPVLRANNLEMEFNLGDLVYVPSDCVNREQLVSAHDIVLAMSSGSKKHVGKAVLTATDMQCAFGAFCGLLRPREGIVPKFLSLQLQGRSFRRYIEESALGTNINNLKSSDLLAYKIVVAPFAEQRRLVAKIDELFSELAKGVESLTAAREQLKAYRQSVLKYAYENRSYVGNDDRDSSWPSRPLGELIEYLTSGSRGWADYYSDHGDIFIRAQNLKHDRLDLSDIAYVQLPKGSTEGMRTRVQMGDVLVTITGANVTKTGVVDRELGTAYVSQHVALCRPKDGLQPEFLYWYLVSEAGGRRQLNQAAYGAGKPGLNLENIRNVTIPLPPLEMQGSVVAKIKSLVEKQQRFEMEIDVALARCEALRQSILMQAFSGRLVAQDPADEPASILLERIVSDRQSHGRIKKGRKLSEVASA